MRWHAQRVYRDVPDTCSVQMCTVLHQPQWPPPKPLFLARTQEVFHTMPPDMPPPPGPAHLRWWWTWPSPPSGTRGCATTAWPHTAWWWRRSTCAATGTPRAAAAWARGGRWCGTRLRGGGVRWRQQVAGVGVRAGVGMRWRQLVIRLWPAPVSVPTPAAGQHLANNDTGSALWEDWLGSASGRPSGCASA